MRRVALIYNPASGQKSGRRERVIRKALEVLRKAGMEAEALETDAPGSARTLTRAAVRSGYDTILACGGDGTVHEVLQCLVGTSVALGVVPLGTANALAQNLGLGRSPVKAVRKLLSAVPTEVPAGRIFYRDNLGAEHSRYFTVAAGIGADALMMSRLDVKLKRRFGYALYLLEAFRVWATSSFPLFEVVFTLPDATAPRTEFVSQLLAVRVRSFGGVLGKLAPGATVHSSTLSLVAFKTRSRLRYLQFLLAVVAKRHTFGGDIELIEALAVQCRTRNGSHRRIHVEADGEVLGILSARMEITEERVMLLVPLGANP
ncbi:MAG TPA: diacylglycerol kinase family protein [Terracidiphilus sp.]|nr:diacylglycerol kinase family protein [Terracidiphilus sp.]